LKLFAFATVRTGMCVHIRKHFPRPLTPGERIKYQISLFECGYEKEREKRKRKVRRKGRKIYYPASRTQFAGSCGWVCLICMSVPCRKRSSSTDAVSFS
jgi:hypothetical protein